MAIKFIQIPRPLITPLFSAAIALLLLSGCAGGSTEELAEQAAEQSAVDVSPADGETPTLQDVEVDKGLLTVEVTIPANLFGDLIEDQTEEEIAKNAAESGYTEYSLNDDGSITYVMPRSVYEETLAEMKQDLDVTIAEIIAESPGVFEAITYDNSITEFDVEVNRAAFESDFGASFVGFSLGISGIFYQIFEGVPADEQEVMVYFVDSSTGESFDSQRWPWED